MYHYPHHIGDFTKDTSHLEPLEECYYRRALDLYYKTELPLDTDVTEVCRLLRAKTTAQKKVVRAILDEFFTLEEDGFHQSRCDREIAEYALMEPERAAASAAKKDNARERKRRNRERRSQMFAFLREHNIIPPFDIKMPALQALVSDVTSRTGHAPVTRDINVTDSTGHTDVTGDGTANQNPEPGNQNLNQDYIYDPRDDVDVTGDADVTGTGHTNVTGQDNPFDAEKAAEIARLAQLPELTQSPPDGRMLTWAELNYESLPEHWRQTALKKYPTLNEASLKAMFINCEGKCGSNFGRRQPKAKWDAEWIYTLSMFAESKLAEQQRLAASSNRNGKPAPAKTNLQCNEPWKNEQAPDYKKLAAGVDLDDDEV